MWTLQVACPDRPGLVAAVATVDAAHVARSMQLISPALVERAVLGRAVRWHLDDRVLRPATGPWCSHLRRCGTLAR